jgi:putative transposase
VREQLHLIRNTFRLTSRKYWDELKRDLKPIYTAVNAAAARAASTSWPPSGAPATRPSSGCGTTPGPSSWTTTWRPDKCCAARTNESLNARYRRAIKARGHFPSEQAAMKCLYLVTRSLDPTGHGRARWAMRWKPALNAFSITFADRFPAAETY